MIHWRTLTLDPKTCSLSRADADMITSLRPMECRLMRQMMEQPVRMYMSRDLMYKVGCSTRRSLTVQICVLNAKLESMGFGIHSDDDAYGLYEARKQ